ncbi:DNA topoisomerase IB [Paraburkholderia phytofirmans]|uniref:DNA topoisomerase n=1 Tax=Paraburkholderia phytofirmans OLGA172 TaxID=1417228 RepID=A0A161HY99_9BURK|nr:DNA topoisomerase IB [Paraburkholderia phytofirmans]ANB72237.1 DNA topoisomerase [Paraburkholderia phytofirmans OLGA172]
MAATTDPTQRRTDDIAQQAAPAAMPPGLRHSDDTTPGYTRRREKDGFVYFDVSGKRIDDASEIDRINALAIPPAYEDVWICPDARGHLQATGRDARGRKQYRYHARWRETRDANKYERMAAFGRALPKIRRRVACDLKLPGMPCDKVIAAIVQLLDTTLIRVGSVEYARDNQSYGLTTLRKKHVKIEAGQLRLKFRGKSGIEHDVTVDHPRVRRIVRRCADLPGHALFQYLDEDGTRRTVGSADINDYLRRASDADFTAKDYRTWAGSVYALAALRWLKYSSAAEARRHIVATVKAVATLLRNTPAVCRRCYIHPAVISAFEADELHDLPPAQALRGLKVDEAAFAALLVQLEKHAAKLARQAGTRGRKPRDSAVTGGVEGSLPTLLKKSRAVRQATIAKPAASAGSLTSRRVATAPSAASRFRSADAASRSSGRR